MKSVGKKGNLLKRKLPGTLKTAAMEEHTTRIEKNEKNTNNER